MAHKTVKLILLSIFEIIEENILKKRGPTNKQAKRRRHDLFLDF